MNTTDLTLEQMFDPSTRWVSEQNEISGLETIDRIDGEPMEFEWNISPGFNTLQLNEEVKGLLYRLGETPEIFTGRILFMSMFNDLSCGTKDNEEESLANAKLASLYARRVGKAQWSFNGLGSEKKWYSISEDSPQGVWDNMAERMLLEFAESGCPICRARLHCPEVKSKAKDVENCRYTMQPTRKRLRLFSHNCFRKSAQSSRSNRRDM